MARNEQLIRQLKLLQLLERSRFGKKLDELRDDLVDDLGLTKLSDRTVRRDLEALQVAGLHVDSHESQRGVVWKLGAELTGIPKIAASVTELVALSMVRDLLVPLTGTPYWQGIESLWKKMEESLPESVWKHFDRRRNFLVVRGTPVKSYSEQEGILATLNRAIMQNRVVEIHYQSRDQEEPSVRSIEPYSLAFYKGSLYLVAVDQNAPVESARRHFKLDRFHKATTLDAYFKPPEDFDPEEHFADSMGVYKATEVEAFRIRLDAEVVLWVNESPWHSKQSIDKDDQGRHILTIPSAYQEEIIPRVLGLNVKAEILSPESARVRMSEIARDLAKAYQTDAS
ncbi:MAG: WYL domain-containing protein [Planctomycetales bacterium]